MKRDDARRVADALASAFTIAPKTDYLKAYPRRSATERMNDAWGKTARDLNGAIVGFGKRGSGR